MNIEINKVFTDLQKKRNIITHSSPNFELTPNYLISRTIECFTFFEGKDEWWNLIRESIINHPTFGYGDYDYELANLTLRLEFIKVKTGIRFLNRHSKLDFTARKYDCPYCHPFLLDEVFALNAIPKWTFLNPNKPDSTKMTCYSCQNSFDVERTKCENPNCKGNVFSPDLGCCLICGE